MGAQTEAAGPDFSQGISLADIPPEGTLSGRVGDRPILLSRLGGELFAVSGTCTHYGAALASGLVDSETVRCPLHHACFDLRTGAALRAPALDALDRWQVEVEGDNVFVRNKSGSAANDVRAASDNVEKVVIVGGGAAGLACAHELRRLGYAGDITMLSADRDPPCDRPNLSKDYLAGTAPAEWLPLRGQDWYADNRVTLRLGCDVTELDPAGQRVRTAGGEDYSYDRLLLATGSEPNHLRGPGFAGENVFTLRSIGDAAAVAALASPGARALIIGASAQSYRESLARGPQRFCEVGAAAVLDESIRARWPGYQDTLEATLLSALAQAVADVPAVFEMDIGHLDWRFGESDARLVHQPTLVVLGGQSAALHPRFEETYRLLLAWLPHAEGFVLPGATHFLQLEGPAHSQGLAEALAGFYGRHPITA